MENFEHKHEKYFEKYKDINLDLYLVGGIVRDIVLNKNKTNDVDWLVANTTHDEMISYGFIPIGQRVKIYLHPETKEEFVLTRKRINNEIVFGNYSVEDELSLRDFNINSMAIGRDGIVINKISNNKITINYKECFEDDPVRLLRLARFAALYDLEIDFPVTFGIITKVERRDRFVNEFLKAAGDKETFIKFIDIIRTMISIDENIKVIIGFNDIPNKINHIPDEISDHELIGYCLANYFDNDHLLRNRKMAKYKKYYMGD